MDKQQECVSIWRLTCADASRTCSDLHVLTLSTVGEC